MAPRSDGVGSGVPATGWLCAIGGRADAAKVPRNARRFTSGLRDNGATTLSAHEIDSNRRRRVDASTAARQLVPLTSLRRFAVPQLEDASRIDKPCTVRVIDDAGSPSARSQPFLPASRIATSRASLFVVPSLA